MAFSALAAGFAALTWHPARAQDPTKVAQTVVRYDFNISPQPLASALPLFGQQSGRQVTADTDTLRGAATRGVRGNLTAEEALGRLLSGTGLTYSSGTGGVLVVQKLGDSGAPAGAQQLDPVQVQGSPVPSQALIDNIPPPFAGGQVATGGQVGMLGNRDLMNTPFSTTSYTEKLIRDTQARTLQNVFDNDPTIRPAAPRFNPSNLFIIRGFPLFGGDMLFNGLPGLAPTRRELMSNIERAEVLRGPTAMLNNIAVNGNVGGQINIVPKRAADEPLMRMTANYMNAGNFGGAADVGRRFGESKEFGARANAWVSAGNTPVNNQSVKDIEFTGGFDWRGERARASFDVGYKQENWIGMTQSYAVAPNVAVPVAPWGVSNAEQAWATTDRYFGFGVVRGEFDILPNLTAYAAYGRSRQTEAFLQTAMTLTSVTGNITGTVSTKALNLATAETAEAGLRGKFETGPISHSVVASVVGTWRENFANPRGSVGAAFASNLFTPVAIAPRTQDIFGSGFQNRASTGDYTSLGVAESMSIFNDRIQFIAGGRLQRIYSQNFNTTTGLLTAAYEKSAFSPSVSLLVKPIPELSVYGNWIQGLAPGPTAPGTAANAGQQFPPIVTTQYEAGAKLEIGKFGATVALFQITQPQSVTSAFTNIFSVDGLQTNSGIEFTTFGEPIEGVRLLGGFTLMKGIQSGTAGGLTDGKEATALPNFMLNVTGEWDLPWVRGLTVMGRTIYTSSQYVDTANTQSIPGAFRFDAGLRYAMEVDRKPLNFRLNVDNVFNNNYWQYARGGTVAQAAPLTLMFSVSRDF